MPSYVHLQNFIQTFARLLTIWPADSKVQFERYPMDFRNVERILYKFSDGSVDGVCRVGESC